MTVVASFIHGIYPRSETLVNISRDVDRKRLEKKDLLDAQKKDFDSLVSIQRREKFDYVEDGKITWHDIFRPIVEACDGIEVGALTRWFDNNSFYRQPIFHSQVKLNTQKLDSYFPKINLPQKWKVTLPSPFLFAKLSQDINGAPFEKRLDKIVKLFKEIIVYLEQRGALMIQLNEPYLPYCGASKKELALFKKGLETIYDSKYNLKLGVHFYFGDASSLIQMLSDSKIIDFVGVDFYKTALESLPKDFPFDLIAGIVEGRNSLLENEETLKKLIEKLIKKINPPKIYLSNNSDLELLPEAVAKRKLELLGELKSSFIN